MGRGKEREEWKEDKMRFILGAWGTCGWGEVLCTNKHVAK